MAVQVAPRAPRLAFLAAALAVLQAFGHAVHAGFSAAMLAMAEYLDAGRRPRRAARAHRGRAALHGVRADRTVLGLIPLGAALLRAGYGPRWLGVVLIAFVVVEFGLSGLSMWAAYLAGALFLVAFLAMAVVTVRGADGEGRVAATEPAAEVRAARSQS